MFEPASRSWPLFRGTASKPAPLPGADAGLRVLLAEDTPICAEMMLAMARHLSIRLDTASNGLDAIAMVHEAAAQGTPYSLLLLDVMMPILDGVETASRLRAEGIGPERLPIIAVTAATDLDEVRAYRKAGMQAFLEKPVGLEDLRSTLNAWGHKTTAHKPRVRSAAMAALYEKFEQRKIQTLARVEETLAEQRFDEDAVLELRTMLHQLAGTAGSFGDHALGEAMRSSEGMLVESYFKGSDIAPVLLSARNSLRERLLP